jgi:hypothetical protein
LLSTPATCFGLLSGHHQALGYTIQLYIYLLLLLTANVETVIMYSHKQ